jgi:imidazolonepropionase-like amidohydrolase
MMKSLKLQTSNFGALPNCHAQIWPVALLVAAGFLTGPGIAHSQNLLLSNAVVHTISGETITGGQVLVVNGKISAVGPKVSAAEATAIDLQGQHLYPGIIALDTILGLAEIGAVRATLDSTESGEYTPDVESWIAVNPDSELIAVTRASGVAFFEPVPEGGVVSGQSGLVTVEGWTSEQRTVKKPIGLHVFWPSMELDTTVQRTRARAAAPAPKSLEEQAKERTAKLRSMEDFFDEAAHYAKAKAAAAGGKGPAVEPIPAWEAMLPYVRGELPVMVHADEIRQIRAAALWAGTNQFKIVLVGARDAWKAADLLASKKIPVVYSDTFTLPPRDSDSYDVQFKAPAVLQKAGVQVAFGNGLSTMDAALTKNLPYSAAQAVAFGLPEPEALKGLTLYPARLAGIADRLGSIESGKEATLFASDGSVLDARARVTHLWVAGKEVSLENRHTRLYEKYKTRPR